MDGFPARCCDLRRGLTPVIFYSIVEMTNDMNQTTVDCKNKFEISDSFDHYYCGIEAAAMFWAGSIVCYLWMFLAINLFVYVVLEMTGMRKLHSMWSN